MVHYYPAPDNRWALIAVDLDDLEIGEAFTVMVVTP